MDDQLPKVVCGDCAFKLDQLFDFREKCLHTEEMFLEMLKEITKQEVNMEHHLDIETIRNEMESIPANIEEIQNHANGNPHNSGETIHTLQVMDDMDLAGGEQVVTQEEIGHQEGELEVGDIHCLDGATVRMVDEHIRDVSTIISSIIYKKITNISCKKSLFEKY